MPDVDGLDHNFVPDAFSEIHMRSVDWEELCVSTLQSKAQLRSKAAESRQGLTVLRCMQAPVSPPALPLPICLRCFVLAAGSAQGGLWWWE